MAHRVALLAILLLSSPASAIEESSADSLLAPAFRVVTVDGDTLSSVDLLGRVLVLDFWHIGCLPCISEISGLNELTADFEEKGVVFISFALNAKKPLARFLRQRPFYYRQVPHSKPVSEHYDIQESPTHIVVDRRGHIAHRMKGGSLTTASKLRPIIRKALETGNED